MTCRQVMYGPAVPGRTGPLSRRREACLRLARGLTGCRGDGQATGSLQRAGRVIPACWQWRARKLIEHPPDQGERRGIRFGSCGEGDGHVQVVDSRLHHQVAVKPTVGSVWPWGGQRLIGAGSGSPVAAAEVSRHSDASNSGVYAEAAILTCRACRAARLLPRAAGWLLAGE